MRNFLSVFVYPFTGPWYILSWGKNTCFLSSFEGLILSANVRPGNNKTVVNGHLSDQRLEQTWKKWQTAQTALGENFGFLEKNCQPKL